MTVWMYAWSLGSGFVCMPGCRRVCKYACMHACIYACMYVFVHVCMIWYDSLIMFAQGWEFQSHKTSKCRNGMAKRRHRPPSRVYSNKIWFTWYIHVVLVCMCLPACTHTYMQMHIWSQRQDIIRIYTGYHYITTNRISYVQMVCMQ